MNKYSCPVSVRISKSVFVQEYMWALGEGINRRRMHLSVGAGAHLSACEREK